MGPIIILNPHFEWVYNRADIDTAKVIWARDLVPAQNRELVHYFKDRKIWSLDLDRLIKPGARLEPYSSNGARKLVSSTRLAVGEF